MAKPSGAAGRKDLELAEHDEQTPLLKPEKVHGSGESCDEVSLLRQPVLWVQQLSRSYSWRLLTMVVVTNHLLKGFVAGGGDEGLVGKPIEFILGGFGVTANRLQMLKAVAISPWA